MKIMNDNDEKSAPALPILGNETVVVKETVICYLYSQLDVIVHGFTSTTAQQ